MELWNDLITDKSKEILFELKKSVTFVLIGGWAIWLYSQAVKSKDIDFYINFDDFFKMQNFFLNFGLSVDFNSKLNKYEVKMEGIDIDIYTPNHCNLIVSCDDVFKKKLFKGVSEFNVVLPEVLLLLKLNAEKQRDNTIKGFKDRTDILSLIYSVEFDKKLLIKLIENYKIDLEHLRDIIKGSGKEYSYFFENAEDLRELKKLKLSLLKKIRF
ncbi:hypothetical protein HYW75_02435 [Candidatus Pacearchaeota archaeon]|nr:hypothetical protein [Candidatus Pacearchaeota archaeon]